MSNPYRDRLLGIGIIGRRTRDRVVEGREHPETGLRYKAVTDQNNATVTEHSAPGATGVSVRQDVHLRPKVAKLEGAS